ncbi:MAG: PD40 domain-containing protein [Anaerolineales bacterium]|nr:PD40 domain-containing protein [Anaerolineales bacterium]
MTEKRLGYFVLVVSALILASCNLGSQPAAAPIPTEVPAEAAPAPAATIIVVEPPELQPTPAASPNGAVIYDDGENILSIDPDTGESKVLVSRKELQLLLTEDRSAESYTYGYARPIPIEFTRDFTKALVTICAGLDNRFRCAFEHYVYFLESKTAIRLPIPSDTYGVYWKWSPDGSKLAGAAWGYDKAFYKLTNFYAVGADGDVLIPLDSIANEHWQIAWNPGGKAFHPLTFVTNFRSIFADDSGDEDIPISGMEFNDKVECLAFSPDGNRAAFVARRDVQKDHDIVYVARSNFTDVTQLTEYDMDSKYLCNVGWSPDGRFIDIKYISDPRAEAGTDPGEKVTKPDRLVNVETSTLTEIRGGGRVCGWTPDNKLILALEGIAGNEGGIEVIDPSSSQPVELPPGLQSSVKHCPVQWLEAELAFDVPLGLSVPNACNPGGTFPDEEDETPVPELYDFIEASASLNGETLTIIMTMKSVNPDLTAYLTSDVTNFVNGFDVLVDVDNNALSGDKFGMEYALSVGILPGAAPKSEGVVGKFDSAAQTFAKGEKFSPSFDSGAKTLTISADIPGITADSRLVFLSRRVNDAKTAVIGDRLCD